MPDRVCTRYRDDDGLDVGCHLVTKEYMLENYPSLIDAVKTPAPGLLTWGLGEFGRLGDNSSINRSSPVQTISGGTNWRMVSAGRYHTASIKTDGTLWAWGANNLGQRGDNTGNISVVSPVQTISGGANWRCVSGSCMHVAATKTDGTLWTWGLSPDGQLGDNTIVFRSSPVQTISGGTNWRDVSAGAGHTAATKTDGTLWLWGSSGRGELGINNTIFDSRRSSPVQTISGGTNWRSVSAGGQTTASIKTDGTLWMWGCGVQGQLGNNSLLNRSSPVQTISGGTNWRSVSANVYHTAATKTDGTLWTWGNGPSGQLGNNTVTNRSSPVQTIGGGTNWRTVSAGTFHTASTKADGTLWTWGNGVNGRLGNNAVTNRSSPVQTISGGTSWRDVSAGCSHTASIRDLGDF